MSYLFSDRNTLIWLMFAIYTVSALFVVSNGINLEASTENKDADSDRAVGFASQLLVRIALIVPMIFIIKNTI